MKPKYMMATTATHQCGDISRDVPDLCYVESETETDYIGSWIAGLGFINVKFPKATTRDLTDEEKARYNKLYVRIANGPSQKINIP